MKGAVGPNTEGGAEFRNWVGERRTNYFAAQTLTSFDAGDFAFYGKVVQENWAVQRF